MAISAFADKAYPPTGDDIQRVLGGAGRAWTRLVQLVAQRIAPLSEEWGCTSAKTGWSLRLKHNGRVIAYLTPCAEYFLVSFALGEKAVAAIDAGKVSAAVRKKVDDAPRYAEGRGVRFEVRDASDIASLVELAQVKHDH